MLSSFIDWIIDLIKKGLRRLEPGFVLVVRVPDWIIDLIKKGLRPYSELQVMVILSDWIIDLIKKGLRPVFTITHADYTLFETGSLT